MKYLSFYLFVFILLSVSGCALFGLDESDALALEEVLAQKTWYTIENGESGDYAKLEFGNRTFTQTWYDFPCGENSANSSIQYDYLIVSNSEISINGTSYEVVEYSEEEWRMRINQSDTLKTLIFKTSCDSLVKF